MTVKLALTHPEPNTKLKTGKCFLFILDNCKLGPASSPTSQGGPTGTPSTFWVGRLANQLPGFHVSGLHKNASPYRWSPLQGTTAATR